MRHMSVSGAVSGGRPLIRGGAMIVLVLAAMLWAQPSLAQYPERPLKIILAWPPGGLADSLARMIADHLGKAFNQSAVVENRPGAFGIIGTQMAAKMPPDGYGLQFVTAETHIINPLVYKSLPYDAARDFEPVAMPVRASFVLAGKADLDANNVPELIAQSKARPGRYSAGSYGVGSTSHIALASLEQATGTEFAHVPYQGVAPVVNALIGGQVDVAFVVPSVVEQHRKSGRVKILGTATANRISNVADVATFSEQGAPPVEGGHWYRIVAPRGMPEAIRDRIVAEVQKLASSAAFADRVTGAGAKVEFKDPAQFAAFLRMEDVRLSNVVRDKKIQLSQ